MRDTRHGLIATLGGWVLGAVLSVYVVIPWVAELGHELIPVYGEPTDVKVLCGPGGEVIISGKSLKKADFYVADNRRPGWLEINYLRGSREYINTYPLVALEGDVVETRPYYNVGDQFNIGPFKFPYPHDATDVFVNVVLPGYRWEALYTTETIGPIYVEPCL